MTTDRQVTDIGRLGQLAMGTIYGAIFAFAWLLFVGTSGWSGIPLACGIFLGANAVATRLLPTLQHWTDDHGLHERRGSSAVSARFEELWSIEATRAFRGADWLIISATGGRELTIILEGHTAEFRSALGQVLVERGLTPRMSNDARRALGLLQS